MAQARDTAIEKYDSIKKFFDDKQVMEHLNSVIPKMVNGERLLRIALGALRQNTELLKCTKASLLAGIVQALQMGLTLDPGLKQAHLVPFWNAKKNIYEAVFIPGYQGYLDLARRAGEVASVSAHVVYKTDRFIVRYGTDKILEHIPNEDRPEKDPIRGAYVVYEFKNGSKEFDYMPWVDIEKRMSVSKAKQSGPWKEWTEEMAVKTVIRHSIKQVGISADLARAAELEERSLIGETQTDLLALPFEIAEEEPKQTPEDQRKEYEDYVKANIPLAEVELWNRWVEETAKTNGKSVEETILRIKNDFINALKWYAAWKAQASTPSPGKDNSPPPQAGDKKEKQSKKEAKTNPVNPEPSTAALTVKCPSSGEGKEVSFCQEKCAYSEGCPALEDAVVPSSGGPGVPPK